MSGGTGVGTLLSAFTGARQWLLLLGLISAVLATVQTVRFRTAADRNIPAAVLLALILTGLAACGGGSTKQGNHQTGIFTLVVVGTDSGVSRAVNLTLTVN